MTTAASFPAMSSLVVGGFDWTTLVINCALLGQTYSTATPGTQTYFSEVQSHEVSGAGYTAGGVALAGKAVVLSGKTARLTADNPTWTGLTASPQYAIFYVATGTAATSSLLCYMDAESVKSASGQLFTVFLPPTGLITVEGI